ncbi:MAG TPA: zeta toxin family protein [Bacteroidales bacterium]|nr:zeta toxin family protein [Bacteroidales bacterium]
MANLFIIAGCNGAGKTTASYSLLPDMLNCHEFVNADEIAKGLSPFQPEKASIDAGRIMLQRIKELINNNIDFAIETTLASKTYAKLINNAKEQGYFITLIFFWLSSPELATQRVKNRVENGGHNIAEEVIYRRYRSGLRNLNRIYLDTADFWMIIDNSVIPYNLVAEGIKNDYSKTYNNEVLNKIISI